MTLAIKIKLTPEQLEVLKPLFEATSKAAKKSQTERYAIFGQVWSATDETAKIPGHAMFTLITPKRAEFLGSAIKASQFIPE